MPVVTVRQAIRQGLTEALETDPAVFLMGEDIGAYGGAYAVTAGLLQEYGSKAGQGHTNFGSYVHRDRAWARRQRVCGQS